MDFVADTIGEWMIVPSVKAILGIIIFWGPNSFKVPSENWSKTVAHLRLGFLPWPTMQAIADSPKRSGKVINSLQFSPSADTYPVIFPFFLINLIQWPGLELLLGSTLLRVSPFLV